MPWLRIRPLPQGPARNWRRYVWRDGNDWLPDLDAVRKLGLPSDSVVNRLRNGFREAHPTLFEIFVARRPHGSWPAHIPFPQRGFDELGRAVP